MRKIAYLLVVFVMFIAFPAGAQQASVPVFDTPTHVIEQRGYVYDLAYSADGSLIAAATEGGISLWDTASGEPMHTFKTEGYVWRLRFAPQGNLLLALVKAQPNYLLVVDAADGTIIRTLDYGRDIRDFDLAPDGDRLALILERYDGTLRQQNIVIASLNDALTGGVIGYTELAGEVIGDWYAVSFDSSGEMLAASAWFELYPVGVTAPGPQSANVWVWPLSGGRPTNYTMDGSIPLVDVQFTPDDAQIFATSFDLLDWETGDTAGSRVAENSFELGLAFGGDLMVTAHRSFDNGAGFEYMRRQVTVRDWRTGAVVATLKRAYDVVPQGGGGHTMEMSREAVAIRADGSQVASSDPNGVISLWDMAGVSD